MSKNYYDILGVSKDADESKIKSAYRKLCLKYHPDKLAKKSEKEKQEGEAKFKEINEAYQILSDPDKKKQYDTFGTVDNMGSGMGGNGFDNMDDLFSMFSGMHGFGGNSGFKNRQQPQIQKGSSIKMKIPVTIDELFNGCTKKVKYTISTRCPNCHGVGGTGQHMCPSCHGTGQKIKTTRQGFAVYQEVMACPQCNGTGFVVDNKCMTCGGSGFRQSSRTAEVTFKSGIQNGEFVIINNAGNESKDKRGANGDFIAQASYNIDPSKYEVRGLDVVEHVYIPYYDLLLGCEYDVKIPNGITRKIKLDSCIHNKKLIKLYREGLKRDNKVGDYYVEINYAFPESLTDEERKCIENIKVQKINEKYM